MNFPIFAISLLSFSWRPFWVMEIHRYLQHSRTQIPSIWRKNAENNHSAPLVKTLIWRKNVDSSVKIMIPFYRCTFPHSGTGPMLCEKVDLTEFLFKNAWKSCLFCECIIQHRIHKKKNSPIIFPAQWSISKPFAFSFLIFRFQTHFSAW